MCDIAPRLVSTIIYIAYYTSPNSNTAFFTHLYYNNCIKLFIKFKTDYRVYKYKCASDSLQELCASKPLLYYVLGLDPPSK